MQQLTTFLFNLWATGAFFFGVLSGRWIVQDNVWPLLLAQLFLISLLTWPLYRRKYERIRAVAGWQYAGLVAGLIVGMGEFWWAKGLWWLSLIAGLGFLIVAVQMPQSLNAWIWDMVFRCKRLEPWLCPHLQSRMQVLDSGVLDLFEVTEIKEQLEGGVVQSREQSSTTHEVRWQGDSLYSGDLKDAENWLLARYRNYRRVWLLPISPEVGPAQTLTRKEEKKMTTTDMWAELHQPSQQEVLKYSPFELRVWTFSESNLSDLEGPYRVDHSEDSPLFHDLQGREGWTLEQHELGLVGRVEVWLRDLKVAECPSLEAAQAEVLSRYREYRQIRGLGSELDRADIDFMPLPMKHLLTVLPRNGGSMKVSLQELEEMDPSNLETIELYLGKHLLGTFQTPDELRRYLQKHAIREL
ncbi:hypothetical protein [Deinococcus cellulosilyticus]|uniref:Uncharacterized protein n=1 Tax=Deinococcus cellulosilyticus (strain DSM 18568 / NBRC 106333 / KACC 11606 / 5516J-15) TaxID=1223518 RepID=A0A511N002_DEIC1|nr:hypothetical protein [Deinococcus cellulosilyticus]GEM46174.1 hypothetical protein DC3_18090 [Deinococcus cellulosilyticus NBRC 106333 = KACC 11606]